MITNARGDIVYTSELIEELKQLAKDLPRAEGVKAIGKRLGKKERQAREIYAKYVDGGAKSGGPSITKATTGDKVTYAVEGYAVDKIEDVIKLCQIDDKVWSSERFSVSQRPSGQLGWNATFRRSKDAAAVQGLLKRFNREAALHAPRKWGVTKVAPKVQDCLYVLNIQDLHMAKLAWDAETGNGDWDIKLAEKAYRDAVAELVSKVPTNRVSELLLIIGSDMLQVDNDQSETTKGTYVDSDTRLPKAFDVVTKMLTEVIEQLAATYRIKLMVVPGNHDSTVSLFLGYYLSAWFRAHPNVIIDNSPKSRKYHGFGKTLLGFDHGDETKLADLPLLLMRENQESISNYLFQEVLTGHLHGEHSHEYNGVRVRVAPALCAADKWHSRKGFLGNVRQSQGLLYQRDSGLEAIYYSKPLLG